MLKHWGTRIAAAVIGVLALVWLGFWIRDLSDPYHLPGGDWRLFKKLFVTRDGRVVDTGNGNITHSEGQAYGMILAEAYGDRRTFNRIWSWTQKNLQTRPNDKLLSWLWKPTGKGPEGSVTDPNNASDGELLAAWALVRASKRWNSYPYQQSAAELLVDLRRLAVRQTPSGLVLLPGVDGFLKADGLVLNPSYYVFPALRELAKIFPGSGWDQLDAAGRSLIREARFGKWRLNPDWLLDGEAITLGAPFPPDFGYNAVRIPLHVAWGDPTSDLLAPYGDFWKDFPDLAAIPATVNLETDAFGPDPSLPGVQSIARFVLACRSGTRLVMRDMPRVSRDEPYYSASLKLLTKVALRDTFGGNP